MSLECVNNGGSVSRIVSACALTLEQETAIGLAGRDALSIWQARVGEIVTVEDPFQQCYRARITDLEDTDATVVPFEMIEAVESPVQICVCQALPEKERFELVLQKMTEIGCQQNRRFYLTALHDTRRARCRAEKVPSLALMCCCVPGANAVALNCRN